MHATIESVMNSEYRKRRPEAARIDHDHDQSGIILAVERHAGSTDTISTLYAACTRSARTICT